MPADWPATERCATVMTISLQTQGMVKVDLAQPLPDLLPAPGDCATRTVRLLLLLHTHPVGQVAITVGPSGLSASDLADTVWSAVPEAQAHLLRDGMTVPERLGPEGVACSTEPACLRRRRTLLHNAPSVTVLIATHDRTDSLMRALRSVSQLAYPRFDVLVVDSAPTTDETARAIDALQGRIGSADIRYVREKQPGLALAHNRGLAQATGSWIAITDDDVVVDPNWLAGIVEGVALEPDVACVTGLILPAEILTPAQELLEQYGGFSRGFTPRRYNLVGHRPADPLFPFTTGRLGSGANMAFDAEFLRRHGGFDPATGAGTPAKGGDDLVAFFRVIAAGRTLVYQPSAILWHWHRRDYEGLRRQSHGYGVGLGAYLTSAVVNEPRLLSQMMRSVVPAARHFRSRASTKNAAKGSDFPRELERAELLGLLQGPFAYAVSRWNYRGTTLQ